MYPSKWLLFQGHLSFINSPYVSYSYKIKIYMFENINFKYLLRNQYFVSIVKVVQLVSPVNFVLWGAIENRKNANHVTVHQNTRSGHAQKRGNAIAYQDFRVKSVPNVPKDMRIIPPVIQLDKA